MRWCRRCVLPDTRPNLTIGADGVCNACATHGTKRAIDWEARRAAFRALVANARAKGRAYDCLIPVSGGKDSTWQVATCLEHGLKPLAVTWRPPGRTELGQRNLDNLIRLGVDHIDYTISPRVERAFTLRAFERFGTPGVPMHMAIYNLPLALAVRLGVPLVVWGENSAFEYGGEGEESRGSRVTRAWTARYGVTHGSTVKDWAGDGLSEQDLAAYAPPTDEELERAGVMGVFLGYYFEWDAARIAEVAAGLGFTKGETARTGIWNFADLDDDFISVHHWLKWYKFGFTRTFDNLALEIRNGRIGREEAVATIARLGDETPHDDIARFCDYLGVTRERFLAIAERFRNPDVWRRGADGIWRIDGFLIPDWRWA